jgi:fructosamine-3-kinase
MDSWCAFYGERRLGHQLRLSRDRGLSRDACARLEKLIARLREWVSEPGQSSLIHGDLWSGNLHVAPDGRPALIDPAAYFGHPEAELGMMALFGGFSPRVWQSYAEARRLEPGWRNRLDLYTLYHVLNHFVLFGGSYGGQADEILRRYVG